MYTINSMVFKDGLGSYVKSDAGLSSSKCLKKSFGSTRPRSTFCGKVDSESEKAGSSIATHDGAPLVTASFQNNIQVMRADAWRPLRYRAEIHEGVGHA